jgi:hypothetical protein
VWRVGRGQWAHGPSDARRSEELFAPARRMANAPASWSTVARHRFGTRPRLPINETMVRSLAPCLCASSEPLANNRAWAKSNQPLVGNIHAGPQLRRAGTAGDGRGGSCGWSGGVASRSWAVGARAERCSALRRTLRARAAHGKRASVLEYGGPPPFWNTPPPANQRNHGSFTRTVSLRELRTARQQPRLGEIQSAAGGQYPRWATAPAGPALLGMDMGESCDGGGSVASGSWAVGARAERCSALR